MKCNTWFMLCNESHFLRSYIMKTSKDNLSACCVVLQIRKVCLWVSIDIKEPSEELFDYIVELRPIAVHTDLAFECWRVIFSVLLLSKPKPFSISSLRSLAPNNTVPLCTVHHIKYLILSSKVYNHLGRKLPCILWLLIDYCKKGDTQVTTAKK